METQVRVDDSADGAPRWLFRFEDGAEFAYARRREFIRCSDKRQWAYVFEDRLNSARSGECLAVRAGNVYYDATSREPLYYELP
jgi:hypothetical protein